MSAAAEGSDEDIGDLVFDTDDSFDTVAEPEASVCPTMRKSATSEVAIASHSAASLGFWSSRRTAESKSKEIWMLIWMSLSIST